MFAHNLFQHRNTMTHKERTGQPPPEQATALWPWLEHLSVTVKKYQHGQKHFATTRSKKETLDHRPRDKSSDFNTWNYTCWRHRTRILLSKTPPPQFCFLASPMASIWEPNLSSQSQGISLFEGQYSVNMSARCLSEKDGFTLVTTLVDIRHENARPIIHMRGQRGPTQAKPKFRVLGCLSFVAA